MPWDAKELEAADDDFESTGVFPVAKRRVSLLSAPLSGTILEIGAGVGATWKSGAYNDSSRFPRVVISEPEDSLRRRLEERIKEAGKEGGKSTGDHIKVIDAKLPHLPFKDEEFDVVAVFFAVSHMNERENCIKEMVRVTKKAGVIVVMDHGLHYTDDSGNVKEFDNGPPASDDAAKPKKNEHHHDHGPPGKLDLPATDVIELFRANESLELRGPYEEFKVVTKRWGNTQCIQATFLRK